MEFEFTETVFLWKADAAWHFVPLPADLADMIRELFGHLTAGWGSIRVRATIGATSWQTSIFPDKRRGTYILPLKAQVRRAEQVGEGDSVTIAIMMM